ncbi:AraC family transcriptional regulator [Rubripirellula amarantea]|uniref:Virulence regulon transcriptional activator VirF n=1 Tax=Rubripirellula amarantea TaxID=2527999 RepID=A0A5C5WJF6_9BACT|nr:AraC family transcriptional regulator [Rubripirellula amarantea]MDA8743960.1 AraC family transcriptional regulator [Rubripirellula amarantea]TWT50279.1 Virulence regulon transcriptional activator VirF [Rubripirellula amarantea]
MSTSNPTPDDSPARELSDKDESVDASLLDGASLDDDAIGDVDLSDPVIDDDTSTQPGGVLPGFVSMQVQRARRFFMNLNPDPHAPLSVVCGGVEAVSPDYFISREDFPYFGIELVVEGEGEVTINGETYPVSAGSVFLYGPGIPHQIKTDKKNVLRKYFIDFVGSEVTQLLAPTDLNDRVPIRIAATHELSGLMEMIIRESVNDSSNTRAISETLLRLLFLKIEQLHHSDGGDRSKAYETYQRIRGHIEANCLSVNTIEEIARQCEVTPVYLSRLFNRFSECGAYQYLLRLKMNHAAGLLLNEAMLVRDVAERLGFADPFQFSRAFKRVYGVPPKQLINARK